MASEAQLMEALKRADAAGNADDARRLAQMISDARKQAAAAAPVDTTPARIPTAAETGLPDYMEGSVALPRAPLDPTTGQYPTQFKNMETGQNYDYTQPFTPPATRKLESDSTMEYLANIFMTGVRGVVEGVANMVDAPFELVNNLPVLVDTIGRYGVQRPFRALMQTLGLPAPDETPQAKSFSGTLADLFGTQDRGMGPANMALGAYYDATGGRLEPEDATGRIIERVTQEMGAAAVPLGLAGRAVNNLKLAGRTGVAAAEGMSPLSRMFVEPMLANPRVAVRREMSAAAAAGAGAGAVREWTDNPYAEIGGAFAGAGLAGAGSIVGGRGRDIAAALSGDSRYASRLVKENVADTLLRNSERAAGALDPADPFAPIDTAEIIRALGRASGAEETIPGFRDTAAGRLDDEGLAALELARQSGPNPGMFRQRQQGNAAAVNEAVEAVAPDATPGAFREALGARRETQLGEAEAAVVQARTAAADAARRITPTDAQADRGNALREQIGAGYEGAQARTAAAYGQVGRDVTVDPADLSTTIDDAVNSLTPAEQSLLPEGLLNRQRARANAPEGDPVIPQALRDDIEQTTDEIASEISHYTKRKVKASEVDAWLAETDPQGGLVFEGGGREGRRNIAEDSLSAEWRMAFEQSKKNGNLKFLYDRLGALRSEEQRAMGATAPPISLEEAKTLRTQIGVRLKAARADDKIEKGGPVAARALARVESALDDFIMRSLTPEQQQAEMAARAARKEQADLFERRRLPTGGPDPVAGAIARDSAGNYVKTEANVAKSFRDTTAIDTLLSRVDTPETRVALRDEILAQAKTGTAADIESFATAYATQLERFPGVRAEVDAAAGAARASENAAASQAELQRVIGADGRGAVAKYLKFGDAQGRRAMEEVIASKDPAAVADELLRFVGEDPAAVEGARRAFWDLMQKRAMSTGAASAALGGADTWMPTAWRKFLSDRDVQAVAARLYRDNPEQWGRINEIANALREAGMTRSATKAVNPSGTAAAARGRSVTMAEAQAKGYEVIRGRVGLPYMITYLATRIANRVVSKQSEAAFARLLDQALLDPEIAADLLKANNPANRAALSRRAKGWLGAEFANGIDAWFEPEARSEDEQMRERLGIGPASRGTDAAMKVSDGDLMGAIEGAKPKRAEDGSLIIDITRGRK